MAHRISRSWRIASEAAPPLKGLGHFGRAFETLARGAEKPSRIRAYCHVRVRVMREEKKEKAMVA